MNTAHRFTTFAGTAIVAGALGLAALAAAGTATASSTDDVFLSSITNAGIHYDSARSVINVAHNVCSALDSGTKPVSILNVIASQNDVTEYQAGMFIAASADAYCPQYVTHS